MYLGGSTTTGSELIGSIGRKRQAHSSMYGDFDSEWYHAWMCSKADRREKHDALLDASVKGNLKALHRTLA